MNWNSNKNRSVAFILGGWMMIAGCADATTQPRSETTIPTPSPAIASSPTPAVTSSAPGMPGVQEWATMLKGDSMQELTFTEDGRLLYQDKVLLTEVPVSYVSNGDVTYAERLMVSDPSPSGRFSVVKACEGLTDESGLCWAVLLVDRQAATAKQIGIAKYGGQNWVQWTEDERYAVFAESMEGVTWFVVLDPQTGESKMFEQTSATADLSSFTWTGDRTFQAAMFCGETATCAAPVFHGNITDLFTD